MIARRENETVHVLRHRRLENIPRTVDVDRENPFPGLFVGDARQVHNVRDAAHGRAHGVLVVQAAPHACHIIAFDPRIDLVEHYVSPSVSGLAIEQHAPYPPGAAGDQHGSRHAASLAELGFPAHPLDGVPQPRGTRIATTVPAPSTERSATLPPWRARTVCTRVRPRPDPDTSRALAARASSSNTCGRSAAGIPRPESATSITALPDSSRSRPSIGPSSEYLAALPSTLSRASESRSRSADTDGTGHGTRITSTRIRDPALGSRSASA